MDLHYSVIFCSSFDFEFFMLPNAMSYDFLKNVPIDSDV